MKRFAIILALAASAFGQGWQISGGKTTGGSIGAPVPGGPPGYANARTDRNLTTALLPPNYPCPPSIGTGTCNSATNGQGLVNTGWLLGNNKLFTDSNYNGVRGVRIADYSDTQAPYNCPGPQVGPGGSAEENIFDSSDSYILIDCNNGGFRVKTFNPNTMQIGGTNNGYTTGWPNVSGYGLPGGGEWDYTTPGTLYLLVSNLMEKWTLSGTVASGPTTVADFTYGVPCWRTSCGDWASGTVIPGTNILPLTNNTATHVFQIINSSNCTTGTYPNFASSGTSELTIITDNTCLWRDIGPVPGAPYTSSITHSYSGIVSHAGQFAAGLANYQGDGGNGSIFVIYYDPAAASGRGIYYSLNTATGNTYTTTCGPGGSGPTCSGGTFSQAFVANIIPFGTQDLTVTHNVKIWKGGGGLTYGPQKCADSFPSTGCPVNGGGDVFFWNVVAGTQYWPQISPGHHASGYAKLNSLIGYGSMFPSVYSFGTTFASPGTVTQFWNVGTGGSCSPNLCPTFVPFDYHSSWVYDNGSDNHPACAATLANAPPNSWPFQYPFQDEIVCFATDGTNTVWREANSYNTYGSSVFNTYENVGGESSDGRFWAISTDWWNTLGSTGGLTSCLGGFNWQASHTYNLNDLISPGTNNGPAQNSSVFKATSCSGACTTGSSAPTWPASGTITDGNVTWTNEGVNTCNTTVVVYQLQ